MADDGILGLLGRLNDPNALYQGALNDPATQQAMAGRGLLAMAGSFADSAMPTRMPTPIGAVLGHAAGALGTSQDAVMDARLRNAQAQLAMSSTDLQKTLGPAYLAQIEAARRRLAGETPGGGIPSPPAPGAAIPGTKGTGPAPTGPINPELVTWEAKNQGINPLIAHATADIESGYGTNTGNKVSPSNTGVFQRAPANAPGGQNDTHENQIRLGVSDLVTARDGLRASLGREPTNAEVYLAHQQGVSGATKLISNPNTPAGELVPAINISNNAGDPKAPASAFVQHWEQTYNSREAKFAPGTLTPPGAGQTAALRPPPGAAVGGLLNMPPGIADRMNEPIPGIAGAAPPVAPGAPGPAAPPAAGSPGPAAGAGPPLPPGAAGAILAAAQQRNSAPGGLQPLPPGLVSMADESGQVPIPAGPPPAPGGPNLVRGGAIPGLLGGGGAAPPPPPQVAAGPPPGQPQSPVPPPVPPIARPQPAAPPPQATTATGPPVPPQLNLPAVPPMPGGGMGPPVQPTPEQMIAQGIVGISALVGKPAPDWMQKLAGQPLEMQMEQYKAYVQAQANQMTEKYKKEIEVASAGTLEWLRTQAGIPAQKELQTHEQDLRLRNEMATRGFLQGPDGKYNVINPAWLAMKAQEAGATAGATATATNLANLSPTYPMGGGPPGATPPGAPPAPTLPGATPPPGAASTANEPPKGTASPYGMLPPLSEQNLPRSKAEADTAVPLWNNRVEAWTAAIQPAQVAEQRMMTIAEAFKSIQSGKWVEQKANLMASLEAIGIHVDPDASVAKVQMVLHENVLSTLPMLKAATRNPTQTEFTTTREMREGPNIQPAANLQMLAEDIAMMRQTQNLPAAFHASGWQNSLQFESAYLGRNKLAPMVKDIKEEIGNLRGMKGWVPPGMPEGTKPGEGLIQGKPYYVLPDGSRRWGP